MFKNPKCAKFIQILIVVVVVVVSIYTAGAASGATGGFGSVFAAGTSSSVGFGAAAGAAAGSVAGQLVGIAAGVQEGFDFKAVAIAGLTGGLTAGLGIDSFAEGLSKFKFIQGAIKGIANNTIGQQVNRLAGEQGSFDWKGLAVAGVAGGINSSIDADVSNKNFGTGFAAGLRRGLVTNAVDYAVRGKSEYQERGGFDVAGLVGNAIASGIKSEIVGNVGRAKAKALLSDFSNFNGTTTAQNSGEPSRVLTEGEIFDLSASNQRAGLVGNQSFSDITNSDLDRVVAANGGNVPDEFIFGEDNSFRLDLSKLGQSYDNGIQYDFTGSGEFGDVGYPALEFNINSPEGIGEDSDSLDIDIFGHASISTALLSEAQKKATNYLNGKRYNGSGVPGFLPEGVTSDYDVPTLASKKLGNISGLLGLPVIGEHIYDVVQDPTFTNYAQIPIDVIGFFGGPGAAASLFLTEINEFAENPARNQIEFAKNRAEANERNTRRAVSNPRSHMTPEQQAIFLEEKK